MQVTYEKESKQTAGDLPKHGKEDATGAPHVGGNTWAGGTGREDLHFKPQDMIITTNLLFQAIAGLQIRVGN